MRNATKHSPTIREFIFVFNEFFFLFYYCCLGQSGFHLSAVRPKLKNCNYCWPITTDTSNTTNHSEVEENTCNQHQAYEIKCGQLVLILLLNGLEISAHFATQ